MEVIRAAELSAAPSRAADYLELTKPRITSLVLLTAAVGFAVGTRGDFAALRFMIFMAGTALLCARRLDVEPVLRARRGRAHGADPGAAARRGTPPAAGGARVRAGAVGRGLALLAFVNPLTLFLGAASLASYVLAYTPLKRVTSLCTVIGAVPGALPPLMGWAAARGALGPAGLGLFAILFLWQLPHFLAIGWLYRDDYARGGFPMLAVTDPDGSSTGRQAVLYATALLPGDARSRAFSRPRGRATSGAPWCWERRSSVARWRLRGGGRRRRREDSSSRRSSTCRSSSA